jgi:hypothetical protein
MRFFIFINFVVIALPAARADGWSPPGHMLSGAIAYHDLQRPEQAALLRAIKPFLYSKALDPDGSLQRQTQGFAGRQADEARFMAITAWADLIRKTEPGKHRDKWHYINWPFKPQSEPATVVARPPQSENILAGFAQSERLLRSTASLDRKATAFAWLLHIVGDVHQPLHTIQLFTREYPEGDRGGNEICVRLTADSVPANLHMLWDGWIAPGTDMRELRAMASELRTRFPHSRLAELSAGEPRSWAQESREIATRIAYMNGNLRGTPKGQRRDCSEAAEAKILPAGYAARAKEIAERRIVLAGYRLASWLGRVCAQGSCGKN